MAAALTRLRESIERHFYRPPPRRPTRKSRGVRKREVAEKRQRGTTKRLRRRPDEND